MQSRGTFRVTFLTALTASLALPIVARADFYLHSWEDQHENVRETRFSFNVGFYSTKNDFDGSGNLINPANLNQYTRIQTDALVSYGITQRISVFGRLGWTRAEMNQTTQVSTNFGFSDSSLGLSFRAFDFSNTSKPDGITIDLQVQGDFVLYSNQNLTGPSIGDGTTDITGGAFGNMPVAHLGQSTLNLGGGAGFTYRTSSFSSAIPWTAGVAIKPHADGVTFSLRAMGDQSLNNDPRASGLAVASTAQSAQSGGSFITNAVNPTLLTLRGELGYQFGQDLGINAFYSQSVWGMAAPNGMYVGAALTARLGVSKKGNAANLSALDYGKSNKGFVNYELEAHVTRVNDRLNIVKIDKGTQDGVAVGNTFDIFLVKKDGNIGQAIARCHVTASQLNESALAVDEYFKEIWIDEGFLAKRPVE